jgi:hypothetical protein
MARLGKSPDRLYLRPLQGFVADLFGNVMTTARLNESVVCKGLVPDETPPQLLSFVLNKDLGLLRLYFDEPVNASTLRPSLGLAIQGFSSRLNLPFHVLSADLPVSLSDSSADRSMLALALGPRDMEGINAGRPRMGTTRDNTFLLMGRGVARDVSMQANRNLPIVDGHAMQLGPALRFFFMDMDAGSLTLVFSAQVDAASFDVTAVTLLSPGQGLDQGDDETFYKLTGLGDGGALAAAHANTSVVATLTLKDLNELKVRPALCVSSSSTSVALSDRTVADVEAAIQCCGGNWNVEVSALSPMPTSWFIPDTTPPRLEAWALDLDSGMLSLSFDEPVQAGALELSGLAVLRLNSSELVELSMNSSVVTGNGTAQSVWLQQGGGMGQELDRLKLMLSDGWSHVGLAVAEGAVLDMAEVPNGIREVPRHAPLPVTDVTTDTTSPHLLYYDLDMDTSMLTLVFDEVVNASVVRLEAVGLHARKEESPALHLYLTDDSEVLTAVDSAVIAIRVGAVDMIRLKENYPLLSSVDYVYMSALGGEWIAWLLPWPTWMSIEI